MKLKFPPLSGGIIQGLNDPGIETFEGDYAHYVVRECAQNSLDAAASQHEPVEIEIAMKYVRANQLPFLGELNSALVQCCAFWQHDAKATEFFSKASRLADARDIVLLRISDYGTTGAPGGDEEMNSHWFGLVRSRGVSVNDETSGGAFGIGKDAPLAASQFRTVIYSTRTKAGKVAVQGISRLATHLADDAHTQGTGFIGNYNKKTSSFLALRTTSEIPDMFLREKAGLDIFIVGFQGETENWEDPFIAAALRNFWPAIHFEKLRIRIGQTQINCKTLPSLMERFRREDSVKEAYPYFQAVVGAGILIRQENLPRVGECRLHVRLAAHDLPRKICMTRKTGMVIYHFPPKSIRVPFAGLFQCNDPKGNQLLKAIEPPCHDNWEVKRAKTEGHREALKEIKDWITSCLKSMIPNLNADVVNEDTIADMLPDELPGETKSDNEETDLGGRPSPPEELQKPGVQAPRVRSPGEHREAAGGIENGGGKGETLDPKDGDGKATGGRPNQTGNDGNEGGTPASPRVRLDLRSYRDDAAEGGYYLIVRAAEGHTGDLRIDAVTEDGAPISCPLTSAFDEQGHQIAVADNRISGVSIPSGGSLRLKIVLKHPMRVALRASTV